jgi:hypothetical protein
MLGTSEWFLTALNVLAVIGAITLVVVFGMAMWLVWSGR